MNCFIFPCFNGNFCLVNKNAVLCTVKKSGAVFLQSFKFNYNVIPHAKVPFLRGIEFLFFGTFYFFYGLYLSIKNSPTPQISNTVAKNLNIRTSYIFGALAILLAICLSGLFLGVIPTHLGFIIAGANYSFFVKKLFIAITKVAMFYLLILVLYSFASIRKLYKFNAAGNIVLSQDKPLAKHRATNYLNVVIFCCAINYFVVSLIGVTVSIWLKPIINVLIFISVFSVGFELCYLLDTKLKKFSHLVLATSYFITSKPAGTEIQTASTALSEGNLMLEMDKREVIKEDSIGGNVAFSLCYSEVKDKLSKAGITETAEADWLIATCLNKNRAEIKLLTQITRTDYKNIQRVLARRVKGEPIEKIFGKTEFYGLPFKVNKNVLTPRKETEILVEEVIKTSKNKNVEILDLCTGSGAIAVTLAKLTGYKVTATDISIEALEVAKANAKLNNVKVNFLQGDLFDAVKKKKFDIITCNPPYIKTSVIKTLDKEVKDYDPTLAIDGGEDGLYFYRRLAMECDAHLKQNGKIFMEIGKGQGQSVKKLFSKYKFSVRIIKDYSGLQRIVVAERGDYVTKNEKN